MSAADASALRTFRQTIDDARQTGLETWLVQSANCTSRAEIASKPFFQRHLYPFRIDVRLDDRQAGLLLDPDLDRVVRIQLDAAGVHDDEPAAVPVGIAVQAVPRRPAAISA